MSSSPASILAYNRLTQLGARSEPQEYRWHRLEDDDVQSQQHT
jgi:hypothetical protein